MNLSESFSLLLVRIAGAAVFLLVVVMAMIMPKVPVHRGVDGLQGAVISFELAGTPDDVFAVIGNPGDAERADVVARMDKTNRIDFLFMIAYPLLTFAIAALLVARGAAPAVVSVAVAVLSVAMFFGDATENMQLLGLTQTTDPSQMAPLLTQLRFATVVKWDAIFVAAIIEAMFVMRVAGAWRWSAIFFGLAGVLGLAGAWWRPGIEHGANVLAIAWVWSWIHALRSRAA
jgi:hypothetical protein